MENEVSNDFSLEPDPNVDLDEAPSTEHDSDIKADCSSGACTLTWKPVQAA